MARELADLVGTMWRPEDEFFGDMLFVVLETYPFNRPLEGPDHDLVVLDCLTGKRIEGYYDADGCEWEVLICPLEKNGRSLGRQYLMPNERFA